MQHKRVKSWTFRKRNMAQCCMAFIPWSLAYLQLASVTGICQGSQQSPMHFLKAREQLTATFFHTIIKVWMKLKPCQLKILNR